MPNPTDTELPPEVARTIDPVCDAFESAWEKGLRPLIEDHLGSVPEAARPLLLAELVRTELEWRCRAGEQPTANEYSSRFPACAADIPGWLDEAHASAEQMAATRAAETDSPEAPPTRDLGPGQPAGPDTQPQVVGEYELLAPLGAGGMGEVYRARHRRLGKLVAVKLLRAHSQPSPEAMARFLREMRALGGLDHPNVVEAHDAGEQGGVVYLAMRLVEGTDLARLVRERGPLPVAEACELCRQAALGLQHLHERGLVHRDLKPSNLMRTPDGVVKVLDLGLARWREEVAAGEDLTGAGRVMGTPDYLAPEQARSAATADIRADLYGLGCTLFYLLTGRPPFAHRTGLYEKLEAHRAEAPPDVRSLRPEVPAALANLVARLLAKRPKDRPRTPAEVALALAAFTGGPPPVPPSTRRVSRRARLIAAGVLGLAALAGLAVFSFGRPRPDQGAPPPDGGNGGPAPEKLLVLRLDVKHLANVNGQWDQPLGLLGKDSFTTRRADSVTVEARLSRPAYAYLIAFRPDGADEVCFPENDDEPPPLTNRPRYPMAESRGVNYGLDEGEGLQVLALVASSRPLPSYKEWRARRGAGPWQRYRVLRLVLGVSTAGLLGSPWGEGPPLAASALFPGRLPQPPPGVVWRDDGGEVDALTADDPTGKRTKGREVSGKTAVVRLTDWLRRGPEVEAVAAVGFAVLPKQGP